MLDARLALIIALAVALVFSLGLLVRKLQRASQGSTFNILALLFVVALALGLILQLLGIAQPGTAFGMVFGAVFTGCLLRTVRPS